MAVGEYREEKVPLPLRFVFKGLHIKPTAGKPIKEKGHRTVINIWCAWEFTGKK
jgi:hypothetical protein